MFEKAAASSLKCNRLARINSKVTLQVDCATLGAEKGACAACGARAQPEAFHELARNDKLGHLARRLGMESFGTILSVANSALGLMAYQQQLVAAKRKKNNKARSAKLKKFKDLTNDKMKEVYSTVQRVRSIGATKISLFCMPA